jgi:AcrR family transcriptional regulator
MSAADVALRERILTEATRLFVAHGYNGISMREIAEAVGVSKAGVYYHFKDKQDLFLAILTDDLNRVAQIVTAAREMGGTLREQVGRLGRDLFAQPPERRAIVRLAGQELANLDERARAEFGRVYHERFIGQIAAMLQDGAARGELRPVDPAALAWLLLGMLYPFFSTGQTPLTDRPQQIIDLLVEVFFDGAAA